MAIVQLNAELVLENQLLVFERCSAVSGRRGGTLVAAETNHTSDGPAQCGSWSSTLTQN